MSHLPHVRPSGRNGVLLGAFLAVLLPLGLSALPLGNGPVHPSDRSIHTELRESRPAADTVVEEVREVLLIYTTPVQLGLSRVTVFGPDGAEVPASEVEHPDPQSTDRLVVRFPSPLPPGAYRVRWSTAGPDSHVLADTLAFRVAGEPEVGPEPPEPEAAPPAADRIPPAEAQGFITIGGIPPGTAQRWIHLLATVLLLGVVVFRYGVLGRASRDPGLEVVEERAERGLQRFGWVAALLLALTLVTRLYHHLGQLGAGEGPAWDFLGHVLLRTAWGGGWFLHLAAVALAVIGLMRIGRPGGEGRGWGIVAGAAILLPLVPALQGHAMTAETRIASIPTLYLHVAMAGAWLGGLLMLVLVGLPAVRKLPRAGGSTPPLARLVNAFSRMAVIFVGLLVASGVAVIFLYGAGVGDLFGTPWGRTLLLKIGVAAAALLLGFYNWRRVRPSLAAHPDPGALRIPATLESILGLIVLLVASALVALALP